MVGPRGRRRIIWMKETESEMTMVKTVTPPADKSGTGEEDKGGGNGLPG